MGAQAGKEEVPLPRSDVAHAEEPKDRGGATEATTGNGCAASVTPIVDLNEDIIVDDNSARANLNPPPVLPAVGVADGPGCSPPSKPVDYTLGKTIGQGAYGKVKLATNAAGHKMAVKIIDRNKLASRPAGSAQLAKEINAMKILRHKNVVRLHEVINTPAKIFLVMEYADSGDMLAYINSRPRLNEPMAYHLWRGVIDGLHFCHTLGVCHRDLKLENLLLHADEVKIADFGMASIIKPSRQCETLCGSPDYAAPELLMEHTMQARCPHSIPQPLMGRGAAPLGHGAALLPTRFVPARRHHH